MRLSLTIFALLLSSLCFCQVNKTDTIIPRTSFQDTIQKFIVSKSIKEDLLYILNGEKVDIKKTFLDVDSINNIVLLSITDSKLIFGDSVKKRALIITTKHKIRFVSLFQYVKSKGIDSSQIVSMQIAIDNKKISDPNILIDSRIRINLLYTGFPEDDNSKPVKKENFVGVLIFTNAVNK